MIVEPDLKVDYDSFKHLIKKKDNSNKLYVREIYRSKIDFDIFYGKFSNNSFIGAVHTAYNYHIPLRIEPDSIWILFLSQVSRLVNLKPEKYRDKFVSFNGKELIEVRNDSLCVGSDSWKDIFPVFEEKLKSRVKLDIFKSFSTTTENKYIVSRIVAMDSVKKYFDYKVTTKCGISEVRIGGTNEDWELLKNSIKNICNKLDLDWFTNFETFINECIDTLNNKGNVEFWKTIYHYNGSRSSGKTDKISGKILLLFPMTNTKMKKSTTEIDASNDVVDVVSDVPFIWDYFGKKIPCLLTGGLTEIKITEDFEVSAEVQWIIKVTN